MTGFDTCVCPGERDHPGTGAIMRCDNSVITRDGLGGFCARCGRGRECHKSKKPRSKPRFLRCPGTELNRRHGDFQSLRTYVISLR